MKVPWVVGKTTLRLPPHCLLLCSPQAPSGVCQPVARGLTLEKVMSANSPVISETRLLEGRNESTLEGET